MINIIIKLFLVLIVSGIFSVSVVFCQFEPYPDYNWYTIETEHFKISYHTGAERTAKTVAKIAEDIYGPITSLYNDPLEEKVNFIIIDISDIANGATDYFNNRISIFATPMDFDLRGTHNWLRNVITHEFTHMVQIKSSMKISEKLPAVYLQWLNYEKERRPDVLYGYPNVIVSYPVSGVGVPAWFAEGTAQYQRQAMGYDYWDAHRDMILRMYVIDNKMLSWNEMGQFSSITSLKAESIYNSGFALVRYISEKYGENKLNEISRNLSDLTNFSVDKAIRNVLNKDGTELYNEWKNYLTNKYTENLRGVISTKTTSEKIEEKGFANYYPKFSPDGSKIAYLSNQDYDFGTTGLYVYDFKSKEKELIAAPVATSFDWSPDGNKIVYAKKNTPPTLKGSVIFDLYEYNFTNKNETRLTKNMRAIAPGYSPDGKSICFLVNRDGTINLCTMNIDKTNLKYLTHFNNGEQIYNPEFSPDGNNIILDYAFEDLRKISSIDIRTQEFTNLFNEKNTDTRNATFSQDGKKIYYSSDRNGIFNIYSYNLESKQLKQITNVTGGAFMPSVDIKGRISFAEYTSGGYKISIMDSFTERDTSEFKPYIRPDKLINKYVNPDTTTAEKKDKFNWTNLKNFNDKIIPEFEKKDYKPIFTNLAFFPVLRYDNYTKDNNVLDAIKPGLYFYSSEIMDRFSIFGGASVNRKLERDLFFQFQFQNGSPFLNDFFSNTLSFYPKFSIEGYNVSRKSSGLLIAGADSINVGVTYDLLEFDVSMLFNLFSINNNMKFSYTFSKYSSAIDAFIIPSSGIGVRASSQDYFKAHTLSLQYDFENYKPNRNEDINPIGRKIKIKYDYEMSKINPEYEVDNNGNLVAIYKDNKLHKLEVDWTEGFGLFGDAHCLSFRLRGATIFGPPVDDFYSFYVSGLPGMRGYPFYALGGGRIAHANLTYRFPLLTKIDTRISPLYFDKLYFSFFGDYGNAWNGKDVTLKDFKKDVGAELRLQAFSFYVFPTSIFFDAVYGMDKFTKRFLGKDVTYGKEWRFYFGILFGFDL